MIQKLRRAISGILRFLFYTIASTDVSGLNNVPEEGGCILAMNHLSILDPPLIYVTLRGENGKMGALVAKKYKKTPVVSWLVNLFGGIWINREDTDFQAIRDARSFLQNGGKLGIAPEGTRSHTEALIPGKTGVAFLAHKAQVPITPIAVTGTEKAFRELARLRRPNITLQFGEPFTLPPLDRQDRAGSLERNTEEIMCQIAVMLPSKYRGVYADYPRLHELLAAQSQ
jgi:1-acyl-sn-glycerol-3-phosphate acyltransferase